MLKKWSSLALCLGTALLLWRCSVNPATGRQQLSFYSEAQEIEIGRQNDEQIVREMGLYGDESLQRYVQDLGERLAAESERPGLPWTFRVVDDPVVNAFALPGGFIYITRGILGHMGSEAELAGVMGHEIGHVTARHGVNQMSKAQLAGAGLILGSVLSEDVASLAGDLQTGLGLLFLKFGRDDERQADELGFRYMTREGYPPRALGEVFGVLERVSQAKGGGALPSWLSTHPNPGNRREMIEGRMGELPAEVRNAPWRRDPYLDRIDGLTYGEDPRQGFFQGSTFYHPEMRFRLDFPDGWQTVNQRRQVAAQSPGREAFLVLELAQENTPRAAAEAFFSQQGVEAGGNWRATPRGLDAVASTFRAYSGETELRGGAAFVSHGGQVFRFLGLSRADDWSDHDRALAGSVASFSELRDRKLLGVEPMRLDLVRLDRAMSVEEFARRYPSSVSDEEVALLNQASLGDTLPAGTRAKRVVGFNPRR